MSRGSFKELTKAVNDNIPTASIPLPDELLEVIQAYLEKHTPIEESDSQRLQDELLNIYQKDVKSKPKRYAGFIAILRELKSAIAGSSRIIQWWETLLIPVLDHLADEKGLGVQTHRFLLDILIFDTDNGEKSDAAKTSAIISEKLLELWLKKSSSASLEGDPATRFLEEQIKLTLVAFGKRRPRAFLTTIDKYFIKKDCRVQMLSLLCEFIRYGPPHLHQFLETPLFTNLLRCLQTDTSTTVVSLALTALTMFLPHIPKDIATHLPSLFNIYCRLLFWDREKILSPESQTQHADLEKSLSQNIDEKDSKKWESISFSPESDGDAVPRLLHYFSFLYGLYPINFMSYIRKPERYLRHANFQGGDDIEVQFTEIRQRSEPFRKVHLLHPNFFEMTIESELTDPNRWLKSDAADVVAQCLALCEPLYPAAFRLPEPIHVSKPQERQAMLDPDADVPNQSLLAQSDEQIVDESRPVPPGAPNLGSRHTTSGPINLPDGSRTPLGADRKVSLPYEDSPTLSPIEVQTDSPTLPPQLLLTRSQDERERRQMIQAEVEQSLPNESQVSLVSNQQHEPSVAGSFLHTLEQGHIPDSPLLKAATAGENSNIVALRREIMLLKNELNFEKYLKQQHLTHIGQLRRKHVREAAAEAETQNLINSNKTLKNKLEEVNNKMMQLKRESEKIRTHSKKWEADLTSKLRALKEEQKKWNLETETLRRELETSRNDNNQLRKLVVSRESEELTSRQKVQSVEINLDEIERLRADVEKLTASVRTHEAREIEIERATASEALAVAKAEILSLKLKAAEDELQRVRLEDTREIESLRAKLENTKQEMHDQPSKGYKSMLDAALAASRARLNDAQKAHAHLLTKYTNLQQQLLAVTDHRNPDEPLLSSGGIHYHFDSAENSYRTSTSPEERRMRRRGLSDPDTDEGMHSYGSSSKMSTYYPIKPAGMDTTLRPASGMDLRSPSSRIASSDHHGHSRSGSVDSTGASGALEMDANGKPKIKPSSEVRVYGRGGVGNIVGPPKDKKKDKKKEEQEKKDKKGTGFRGIRGFQ